MPREFSRADRVRKALIREVSDAIHNIQDPLLENQVVSVTDVDVSRDFSHAKVYISVFTDEETRQQILELLQENAPRIQKDVGRRMQTRHTTKFEFRYDESLERGSRVNELLKKISRGEA